MNPWLGIAIGLVLTVGTGLFVAAEFALVNLDRHDLEKRRDAGERGLSPTINALRITSTHLSSAQLGITLTTLLTGYTFEPAISRLLEGPLESAGVADQLVRPVGAVTGVLLATLLSMVVGELVPKNFALAVPRATAKLVVPFQAGFTAVFKPVIRMLNGSANQLIRAMGIEPKEELSGARTAEELGYLVRHSASAGLLEDDDATLLDRTLRFSGHDAGDVMTPRVRMVTVPDDATVTEILEVAARTGFSRMPVIGDNNDDIVGLVSVRAAFATPLEEWLTRRASDLMTEPARVPETLEAGPLLELLRSHGTTLAVVTDEHGGTAGVVTMEDLVEEIVGEVTDEHDRARSAITRRGDTVLFDPALRPDELLYRAGIEVPEGDDWDTVGGFVAAELGRVPEQDDRVELSHGSLVVERVDGPRLLRLRYLPGPRPVDDAEGDDG